MLFGDDLWVGLSIAACGAVFGSWVLEYCILESWLHRCATEVVSRLITFVSTLCS